MKYLQLKNRFLLMHDWKKLLIALHYLNDRTQKLDSRNYSTRILQIQCFFPSLPRNLEQSWASPQLSPQVRKSAIAD